MHVIIILQGSKAENRLFCLQFNQFWTAWLNKSRVGFTLLDKYPQNIECKNQFTQKNPKSDIF